MNTRVLWLFLAGNIWIVHAHALDIYVSPVGSDYNPGTYQRPLKTLLGAQQKVRASKSRGLEPINILFRSGTYYLSHPLELNASDSGTRKSPIVYKARAGEKVVISGGVRLQPNWTRQESGVYRTAVTPGLVFDQLFLNGRKQTLARFPNYDPDATPYNGSSADAFSRERAQRWQNPSGGFIHAMHRHHWGGYHYQITGKDSRGNVTYEGGWQNNRQMGMHPEHRMVENIKEELDTAGEWFLDPVKNTLDYIPIDPTVLPTSVIEVAYLKHLIELTGTPERPVQHVSFKGFTFRHTARTFMETREPLLRSDWTIYRGGALVIENAEDCGIVDCEFDQLGGNAIFVSKYNRRIRIADCHLHDCGASGVCFVGDPDSVRNPRFEYGQNNSYAEIDKERGPKGNNYPADCLVDNCLIHNMSVVEKQATGVQVSMSRRITIRHCSIYNLGRAGINVSEGTFGGHVIENCDVFNTVRETGDHGSFNSWGRDRFWHLTDAPNTELPALSKLDTEPTIIRNNRWRCDRGWDVDLDDGSSHYEIYNNLFLKGGLKLREGFYRNVYNNIAVNNTLHPHVWYENSMDRVTGNIWMGAYRPAGGMPEGKWGEEVDRNFFTTRASQRKFLKHECDANSVFGDPLFLDPENGDFRISPNSPAHAIGFKNFPMDQFGVRSIKLKAIAKTPPFPTPLSPSNSSAESLPSKPSHVIWRGMVLRPLKGEEFSAFGVSREKGGFCVTRLSTILESPFLKDDVIQEIDDLEVVDTDSFQHAIMQLTGATATVQIVRQQKAQTVTVTDYPCLITETSQTQESLIRLPLPEQNPLRVFAKPLTNNNPISTLIDNQLSPTYGPVFSNGVLSGCYKTDLGELHSIKQLTSWSYGQDARGTQNLQLYGSQAAIDPGWNPAAYEPIGSIVASGTSHQYTAAALRAAKSGSLGRYRWILWRTSPVTDVGGGENTAFQELAVETGN